jgi:tRNA pseudouridine55 synthase
MMARKRKGAPIHGWIVLDKPLGMSSSQAVGAVRRITGAAKAGHGGTLDPLATGVLPIALGEATKTVGWAMAGRKTYRFSVRWGEARTTEDAEGVVTATSAHRPGRAAVEAALPRFTGRIMQRPPVYSAIKVGGERAYALARASEADGTGAAAEIELAERPVEIESFRLVAMADEDHAEFEVRVGKGTYVRALARDLALTLGTVGYVAALRRISVGPFDEKGAISLDKLAALGHSAAASEHLLPIETALDDIPALALTEDEAHRLRCGQAVTPMRPPERARLDQLGNGVMVRAKTGGMLVALAETDAGWLRPVRVINP